MRRGQLVHAVAVEPGVEIEAHQNRVVERRDGDPEAAENGRVVFEVVPDLEDAGVLEQRLEFRQHQRAIELHGLLGEPDRKSVVSGKSVSVSVDLGGRRIIKKKKIPYQITHRIVPTQNAQTIIHTQLTT